jgi:hypothetical protein
LRYFLLCLLLLPVFAEAITPPPPVTPTLASVIIEITPATVRADNVTPFTAAEIKENRLYFTQLSAYIAVAAGVKTYTYIVPSGQCFRTTDGVAGTTVDSGNLESEASAVARVTGDRCSGKSLPGKPGVVITAP